jgi:hypothetical protein
VKRSGRDEPIWLVIRICMETLGILLYNYLYLKLAKMLFFLYYLLCFLFNKIGEQDGRTRSAWKPDWWVVMGKEEEAGGKVTQTMYTHMNKCKIN